MNIVKDDQGHVQKLFQAHFQTGKGLWAEGGSENCQ
jgi:hypothetical protein